jgi:hypothetical protein
MAVYHNRKLENTSGLLLSTARLVSGATRSGKAKRNEEGRRKGRKHSNAAFEGLPSYAPKPRADWLRERLDYLNAERQVFSRCT